MHSVMSFQSGIALSISGLLDRLTLRIELITCKSNLEYYIR